MLIFNLCGEIFILSKKNKLIYTYCINLGSFPKMQHAFDTSKFSLKYVKQILGLFTKLCIFCNFYFKYGVKYSLK